MFTRFFGAVRTNLLAATPAYRPVPHDRQHLVAIMEPLSLVGQWHFVPLDPRYTHTYLTWPPPEERDTYKPGQPEAAAEPTKTAKSQEVNAQMSEKMDKKSA